MTGELDDFMVHQVTVRPLIGEGGLGQVWGPDVTYQTFCDDKIRRVTDASAREIISSTTVYDTDVSHAPSYAPGSQVTTPSGRTATVIGCGYRTSGPLALPDHLEVTLT